MHDSFFANLDSRAAENFSRYRCYLTPAAENQLDRGGQEARRQLAKDRQRKPQNGIGKNGSEVVGHQLSQDSRQETRNFKV